MVRFPGNTSNIGFSLLQSVHTGSGVHPAFFSVVTGVFPLDVKRPGHATDHSHPLCSEVVNEPEYTPLCDIMVRCLTKYKENYIFYHCLKRSQQQIQPVLEYLCSSVLFYKKQWTRVE